VTLEDAKRFIEALPKKTRAESRRQYAEALLLDAAQNAGRYLDRTLEADDMI
jgi:hypothetical protein